MGRRSLTPGPLARASRLPATRARDGRRRAASAPPRIAAALLLLVVLLEAGGAAAPAAAQAAADGRIEEARLLRERGELAGAAERLRDFLGDHPEDATALRLLAGVLEQSGNTDGALEALERAVRLRPGDPLLRLDYGRMLVDRSRPETAREVLRPVADDPGVPPRIRADAHVELGRAAIRSGELDEAEELLRRALDFEARHPGSLRRLRSLYRDRSSSVSTRGSVGDDDQPLRRAGAEVRAEWRMRRWLGARLLARSERLSAAAPTETLDGASVGADARWDPLNLELVLRGGGYRRSAAGTGAWTAGGSLGVTGPGAVTFRLETAREPYLLTSASVEEPVDVVSFRGVVERPDVDGWSGLLSYREDRFDDDNRIRETTARVLAPLTTTPAGRVRVGYRFHLADADDNAFRPLMLPDEETSGRLAGRYEPVYTPEELRSHSLLMDLTYAREGGFRVTGAGSWGFRAQEERPFLFPAVPGAPEAGTDRQFRRRSFTPWHLVGRLELPVLPTTVAELRTGYETTAFRSRWFLELGWTYYLIPADLR